MSRKIIILCGSPRKAGNTNRVAAWVEESAAEAGAEVEIIHTARLKYKSSGCIACMECQASDRYECAVEDEAMPLLARLPEADAVVMATPVYWFAPTAQLKVFTDRMFSLIKMNSETGEYVHPMEGKTLALIATGGGDMESGLNCVELTFRTAAAFMNMKFEALLVPQSPTDPADIEKDDSLREHARAFGRRLASG